MKLNETQVDALSAEYVLGTLHGSGRLRFEQLLSERGDIRQAVWRWERHLNQMACAVTPSSPPPRVWKKIQFRIERSSRLARPASSFWRGLWLALPTAAASAWIAITFLSGPIPTQVAVFANQDADAMWVVSANLETGSIRTEAVGEVDIEAGSVYELWVLPADGPPLSLGLLPEYPGAADRSISDQLAAALAGSGRLAISIEPAGGSPTGLPTGPVVYQASLLKI